MSILGGGESVFLDSGINPDSSGLQGVLQQISAYLNLYSPALKERDLSAIQQFSVSTATVPYPIYMDAKTQVIAT
ncbi:hypothetical protein ACN4EK_06860 [Pantanalinema rosaneae CENA516]